VTRKVQIPSVRGVGESGDYQTHIGVEPLLAERRHFRKALTENEMNGRRSAERDIVLTNGHFRTLERFSEEFRGHE